MQEKSMSDVTADQVRDACLAAGITRIEHHDCSMCGYMTAYIVRSGQLYFDPGCDCTGRRGAEPRSWQSAADWINMQTRADVNERLRKAFGITEQAQ